MTEALHAENTLAREDELERLYPLAYTMLSRLSRIKQMAARLFLAEAVLLPVPGRAPAWGADADAFKTSPSESCFVAATLAQGIPLVVPDALADPRFAANPNVTGELKLRFFAGCPVLDALGHRLGVLAVFSKQPRNFSAEELLTLRDMVQWTETELHMSRMGETQIELIEELNQSQRDTLLHPNTRTWNRTAIATILAREIDRARRAREPLALAIAELDHMDFIRDTYGAASADAVIQQAAKRVLGVVRPYDAVGYWGGGRFLIVLPGCKPDAAYVATEKLRSVLASRPCDTIHGTMRTSMSVGVASCDYAERDLKPDALLQATEIALQQAKDQGRNQVMTN